MLRNDRIFSSLPDDWMTPRSVPATRTVKVNSLPAGAKERLASRLLPTETPPPASSSPRQHSHGHLGGSGRRKTKVPEQHRDALS